MDLTLTEILISFIGGFLAGILNTLAGFGSIISLAIYMDLLGIPGPIANATNRINVLGSSSISAATFYKNDMLQLVKTRWILAPVIIGAIIGIFLAVPIDEALFKSAFNWLLIPILIILILNPKKFLKPDENASPPSKWILVPLLFLMGVYAGFIQIGFGVIFLMIMVILGKQDLIKSNALKVAVVASYTIIAVIIFQWQGMLMWGAGIALAIGQGLGGYITARNASRMKGANIWAYRLLIVIVALVIFKNFELWKFFV
ncbi:MAG: sulfite exporter TauE/SafE family protein [Saprospiraceae bacterium]|nr:sulfite exporter TauE/SafE family protein [Saprospiraceae bacterium]